MALAMVALLGAILLLDKHLPTLLQRSPSGRRWRLPSALRMRTDP